MRVNSADSSLLLRKDDKLSKQQSIAGKLNKKQSLDSKTLAAIVISSPKQQFKHTTSSSSSSKTDLHSATLANLNNNRHQFINGLRVNDLRDLHELKKALLDKKLVNVKLSQMQQIRTKRETETTVAKPANPVGQSSETGNGQTARHNSSGSNKQRLVTNKDNSPQKRHVTLYRDENLGFGFIAGSEKPLVIRFVTPGKII